MFPLTSRTRRIIDRGTGIAVDGAGPSAPAREPR